MQPKLIKENYFDQNSCLQNETKYWSKFLVVDATSDESDKNPNAIK